MRPTLLVSVVAIAFAPPSGRSNPSESECQVLDKKVVALIGQYKELRERQRRLPEGGYDKELRDQGGKMHRVLQSLGTKLGHPPYSRKTIIDCVGEPDVIKTQIQMAPYLGIYERERTKAGREPLAKRDREYLIYHWRGGHDFLFFISETGLIVDHGWWFAYE